MNDDQESISANDNSWKSEVRDLMKRGIEFVVAHLQTADYPECRTLAQKFGYSEFLEDAPPACGSP